MAKTPARIILLKTVTEFDDAIDDFASLQSKEFTSNNAKLYWKLAPSKSPKWVKNIFPSESELQATLKTQSITAVLLVKRSDRLFAITFGHGKNILKQEIIESRFGLKVVLNRVDPESLRSIDTKSLDGFLSQTREQVPSLSPMSNFGLDVEKDFIKAVTGTSTDEGMGKTITGADSFYASVELELATIPALLDKLLLAFNDTTYKDNFEFVDNIAEVPKTLADQLNEKLVEKIIAHETSRIWLAPPDIMDWSNHGGFSFKRNSGTAYDDIGLESYLSEMHRDLSKLNITKLKTHKLLHLTAEYDIDYTKWSIFKCLYAEIEEGTKRFILSDGKWFEVDEAYVARIKADLDAKLDGWSGLAFPDYESDRMAIRDENKRRGEGLYNFELAESSDYTLLDARMITHGGANSKIELCDLYKDDLYIHVKRYTRSSGLSHLFNQGRVSAELLCSDIEFRLKAAQKISDQGTTSNLNNDRPDMTQMHIVFAVVSAASGELQLPFFSQVALKNTLYFLKNTLNVGKVSLVKIQAIND